MHVVQQGYFSRIYWNMFKSVRHSVAVDRVVGGDTNVEKKIKRPIGCDDTDIAYTGALVAILSRKAVVWFRHKQRVPVVFYKQLASVYVARNR
jgi:hypothetical protein